MRKVFGLLAAIGIVTACSVLVGCGKRSARKTPAEAAAQAEQGLKSNSQLPGAGPVDPAQALNPVIQESQEEDGSLPNETSDPVDQEKIIGQDEILFKSVIRLPDSAFAGTPGEKIPQGKRPFFLAWEQDVLGDPIQNAYFSFEKRDALNRKTGTRERVNASYDSVRRRWFIPLADALGGKPENVDPSEIYWITLELHLEKKGPIQLRIGMRALGPLPRVQVKTFASDPPFLEALDLNRRLWPDGAGWTIARERYLNPSARPMNLWVRLPEHKLVFHSSVSMGGYFPTEVVSGQLQLVPIIENHRTQMGIDEFRLSVIHTSGLPSETVKIGNSWKRITLNPYEEVALEWKVFGSSSLSRCAVPGAEERVFWWMGQRRVCIPRLRGEPGECEFVDERRELRRTHAWSVTGARLEGGWTRDVILADDFIPSPEWEVSKDSSERARPLLGTARENGMWATGEGVLEERWPLFGCQGLF